MIDPHLVHERSTFEVPVEGLIAFIASAFARGASDIVLFDGRHRVRVTCAVSPI